MNLIGRVTQEPSLEELATLLLALGRQLLKSANASNLGERSRAKLEESLALIEAYLARKQGRKPN